MSHINILIASHDDIIWLYISSKPTWKNTVCTNFGMHQIFILFCRICSTITFVYVIILVAFFYVVKEIPEGNSEDFRKGKLHFFWNVDRGRFSVFCYWFVFYFRFLLDFIGSLLIFWVCLRILMGWSERQVGPLIRPLVGLLLAPLVGP